MWTHSITDNQHMTIYEPDLDESQLERLTTSFMFEGGNGCRSTSCLSGA